MAAGGLFCDLDGTLCDSLTALRGAYQRFMAGFGLPASDAEFDSLNGPPLAQLVAILRTKHGLPGTDQDLLTGYLALAERAQADALPASGAAILLARARQKNWQVWVVTSGRRDASLAWLARHSLDKYVDGLVGGDEVSRGKPDPEPYLLALQRSGLRSEASLAVEDSEAGAQAALAARLPTWLLAKQAPLALKSSDLFQGTLPGLAALAEQL